jgi:hypothetical protein
VSYSRGAAQSSQHASSDTGGDGYPGGYIYVYPYGYPGDGYIYGD